MREGSLFSGYNGLGMAVSQVFGAEPAWFSEIDDAPSKILAHHWPDVPNLGDITAVDWDTVEPVDILSGGFPCQDVSLAGKRAGMTPDTRSGLWNHMAYAISKLRPRYVVAENVRGLLSAEAHSNVEPCTWCLGDGPGEPALRALGAVLGDLADLGYDAQWVGIPAASVGAPHLRFREFILAADAGDDGRERGQELDGRQATRLEPSLWYDPDGRGDVASNANVARLEGRRLRGGRAGERTAGESRLVDRTATAHTTRDALREQPVAESWRSGQAVPGLAGAGTAERRGVPTVWGQYAPAIERWERILGRVAPAPTEPGARGGPRLSPRFVEWMQGLPAGHVTAVPGVNRNAQLKALGNGVVPQQAIAALRHLMEASA